MGSCGGAKGRALVRTQRWSGMRIRGRMDTLVAIGDSADNSRAQYNGGLSETKGDSGTAKDSFRLEQQEYGIQYIRATTTTADPVICNEAATARRDAGEHGDDVRYKISQKTARGDPSWPGPSRTVGCTYDLRGTETYVGPAAFFRLGRRDRKKKNICVQQQFLCGGNAPVFLRISRVF